MLDILGASGKLEKMRISALLPAVGDKPPEEDKTKSYTVLVNPTTYSVNLAVQYTRTRGIGASASEARHRSTQPQTMEFEFLFDATGVIPKSPGPLDGIPGVSAVTAAVGSLLGQDKELTVIDQINALTDVVYKFEGRNHRPNTVRLIWGKKMTFDCVLRSLNITFKLFKPDGTPLRAVARASFEGTVSNQMRALQENRQSPDLTHVRTVKAGDTLPLMCHNVYGDASLYIEVARVNHLIRFRNLKPGTKIFFPPVNKTKK